MATATNAQNMSNDYYACESFGRMVSGGLFYGRDLTKSTLSLLLLQISLANSITSIIKVIFKHFELVTFVPEMLSGIAMGPSVLSRNETLRKKLMAPLRGNMMINAFENLALIFLYFLLTVQVDFVSIMKKTRKLTFTVGIACFVLPLAITVPTAYLLKDHMPNQDLQQTLPSIAFLETISTFRTVLIIVDDLKLLNSELGQTALTAALIAGTCNIFLGVIIVGARTESSGYKKRQFLLYNISRTSLIVVIVYVCRPIMLWMMRQTPERKSLKEKYICIIIIMILGCSLFGEITGQHAFLGPIILGMVTPDSPPMGTSLINKLGSFVWIVFMPCYAINVGKQVNIFDIGLDNFITVVFFAGLSTLARLLGSMIPTLYYKMPLKDAFPLSLILTSRGIFDLIYYYVANREKYISGQTFSIMVLITMVHSIILSPIFKAVYDTSRRYMVYDRRTIQHMKQQSELEIVVCIHNLEDVSSIINILEISNPTKESPLTVFVMNLEELVGRLVPLFISHIYDSAPSDKPTRASEIISTFSHYEEKKLGLVRVQCFTSVVSYTTMYDYICTLANEKSTSLIIIPFQHSDNRHIRAVNKKVLENAPCSVAVFFGRGILTEARFLNSHHILNVCVVFLGGSDDREALAYGARMLGNPCIRLTVVRLVDVKQISGELAEEIQDIKAIKHFKINTYNDKHVKYKEKILVEVSDTAKVLQCMENDFDLMVIGRRHDNESPLLKKLSEWIEYEELGVIGDIFVSSEVSMASVLLVQQQSLVVEEMLTP
ncbi:hypothetical protein ACOSP7_003071 [Xanthoceras sorbifolium]